MNRQGRINLLAGSILSALMLAGHATVARAQGNATEPQSMPSGQVITPLAPAGAVFTELNPGLKDFPDYTVGQAVKTVTSPDGGTLLVLTSGYNRLRNAQGRAAAADSNEYVFIFDLTHDRLQQTQVLQIPNTFFGLAFSPSGNQFYVSGGVDDNIHAFARTNAIWAESGAPVTLGHEHGVGFAYTPRGDFGNSRNSPTVANVAVAANGKILVAADIYSDAISIVDLGSRAKVGELDLRPGIIDPALAGVAGGESPFGVAIKGNSTAYVSSERDREIDVVDISISATPKLLMRIPVHGNPNSMVLNAAQTRLFVTADNSDRVSVINTATNRIVETIRTTAPLDLLRGPRQLPGAAPNSLVLSPDETTLYVTNGGMNAIAVISLAQGKPHDVVGLIPTGWYPQSVSISRDGKTLYDVNSKSNPGPNPLMKHRGANQYILQLEKAGLQAVPVPDRKELAQLTKRVAANDYLNNLPDQHDEQVMGALRQHIKHVIYIIKENRTYDQVLGDLDRGNGDPSLAMFGKVITPNQHQLSDQFVDLDNFLVSGEVSGNGWPWSTAARETDSNVKAIPLGYAGRGSPRSINLSVATVAERRANDPDYPNDPNLLPGTNDDDEPDGPEGQKQQGNIWNSVLLHGLTIRNYGFKCDIPRNAPEVPDPFASHTVVAIPGKPEFIGRTDPYFRPFDNVYPDFLRELEWEREFNQYVANRNLPSLELVRFMHDHEGDFSTAIDGINTPEKQTADNDYAVGKLIEQVAHSPYSDSTLIFIVEDDAQDGPDHVDAHRSIAFVVGPYVKQRSVVHERYSTVNIIRTMEDVLGIGHLNLNDAYQRPMTAVFDLKQSAWTYTAITPAPIAMTLGKPQQDSQLGPVFHDAHSAAYWARQTRGFDWSNEDKVPTVLFNQILWKGLTGGLAYPSARSGQDYSRDREAVLKARTMHLLHHRQ
jgi:YVTN family beta-propeller protein